MKSRPLVGLLFFALVSLLYGCKSENKDLAKLQNIVETINSSSSRDLGNGTVLTGCEFQEGDSLLTYKITISDNRYEKTPSDSIRSGIFKDLHLSGKKKLTDLLIRNSIGIRYVCKLPDREETFIFTPEELKDSIQ